MTDTAPGGGTRVTATDIESGESESVTIRDDYVLIVDGTVRLDSVRTYPNGTVVLTVRRGPATDVRQAYATPLEVEQ